MIYESQKNIQSSRLGNLLAETGHMDWFSHRVGSGYNGNGGYNADGTDRGIRRCIAISMHQCVKAFSAFLYVTVPAL